MGKERQCRERRGEGGCMAFEACIKGLHSDMLLSFQQPGTILTREKLKRA